MRAIFAPEEKIIAERKLWIAVARAQSGLGHAISDSVIADYEKVITKVDLASIDAREKVTRHDVKARIEEFNALAGHEAIHAGMTSRDLTENIEALQIKNGLDLIANKVIATLAALAAKVERYWKTHGEPDRLGADDADEPARGGAPGVPACGDSVQANGSTPRGALGESKRAQEDVSYGEGLARSCQRPCAIG
jgi:hypothetical protein